MLGVKMCLSGHLMWESTRQHHQGKQLRYEDAIFPPCIPARRTAGMFDMLKMCLCWLLIGIVGTNVRSKHSSASPPYFAVFLHLPSAPALQAVPEPRLCCWQGSHQPSGAPHLQQTTINSPAKPDNGMHSPFFLLQLPRAKSPSIYSPENPIHPGLLCIYTNATAG